MQTRPEEGVVKEEKCPNSSKPPHRPVCGEFWNLRVQNIQEKTKTKTEYKLQMSAQLPAEK